jgi:hypothetical protein
VPSKWLKLDLSGWKYKSLDLYKPPKILVRQAGVGLFATLDETRSRCPQSVYVYRLTPEYIGKGYRHEFVLAALLSRTMAYYVFKRFAEVDPDKAHAKLTHERLAKLPIPMVNFADSGQAKLHAEIVDRVHELLTGNAILGGEEDRKIELALRLLWAIGPEDGAYINGEFYDLPDGQALRELFPNERPKPVALESQLPSS